MAPWSAAKPKAYHDHLIAANRYCRAWNLLMDEDKGRALVADDAGYRESAAQRLGPAITFLCVGRRFCHAAPGVFMFRHVLLALTLVAIVGMPVRADSIGVGSHRSPYGPLYSASSSPFEAFEWTPLDFAAFSAYGGDFSNVRRSVVPVFFFDDAMQPAVEPGPEDEQVNIRLLSALPFFEEFPAAMLKDVHDEELVADVTDAVPSIPEPGALMLVGLGLLGLSRRVRTYYAR